MKILVELFWDYACASWIVQSTNQESAGDWDENIISKHYAKKEIEEKLLRAGIGQSIDGEQKIWPKKDKNDWTLLASIAADNSDDIKLEDIEGNGVLVHAVDADRLGVKCTANLEMEFDLANVDEGDLKQAINDCAVLVLRIPVSDLLDHGCSQEKIDECFVIDDCVVVALEEWDSLTVSVGKI